MCGGIPLSWRVTWIIDIIDGTFCQRNENCGIKR